MASLGVCVCVCVYKQKIKLKQTLRGGGTGVCTSEFAEVAEPKLSDDLPLLNCKTECSGKTKGCH